MQIQKVNGQSLITNKQQEKSVTQPSFGLLIKTTPEFAHANIRFGIQDALEQILTKTSRKYKKLDKTIQVGDGILKTEHGDVFGDSFDVFISSRPDDFKRAIKAFMKKIVMLQELQEFVPKLNKAKKINLEFEKNTIDSPDNLLFGDLAPVGEHYKKGEYYKNIISSIKDAARFMSKRNYKDDYVLKLGFNDKKPGVVVAKFENNYGDSTPYFDLKPKHNSKTIDEAIAKMNKQK